MYKPSGVIMCILNNIGVFKGGDIGGGLPWNCLYIILGWGHYPVIYLRCN